MFNETFYGCIHTEVDVICLLDLSRRGLLGRITRRFSEPEKKMIRSGSVIVYEEQESNIVRWTDGRRWALSKRCGIFLLYREIGPDSNVLLKKTLKSKIHGKVFHVIGYQNMKDEASYRCCSKYEFSIQNVYNGFKSIYSVGNNLKDINLELRRNHVENVLENYLSFNISDEHDLTIPKGRVSAVNVDRLGSDYPPTKEDGPNVRCESRYRHISSLGYISPESLWESGEYKDNVKKALKFDDDIF
jgi:hypothetical protein